MKDVQINYPFGVSSFWNMSDKPIVVKLVIKIQTQLHIPIFVGWQTSFLIFLSHIHLNLLEILI